MKVKSESEVAQLCPSLCDPINCSLPGSSVHGIFQARVLEWGAIAFSNKKYKKYENVNYNQEKKRFFFKQVINYKPQTFCGKKVVSVCVCVPLNKAC